MIVKLNNNTLPKVFITLICIIGLYSCSQKEETHPIVIVEKPVKQDIEVFGEYVGQLTARQKVEVRARVDGFLESMHFQEGKLVKEGDVLFTIEPSPYEARVNRVKAQLAQAKAAAAKAKRDVDRLKPLYEQNAASQLDLDNAITSLENERANIMMYEAELSQAELELSFTKVKSPLTGYIGERQVDIGTLVGSKGASLLTSVFQTDTVFVHFHMTALDYLNSQQSNVNLTKMDTTRRSFQPTVMVTKADRSEYPLKGIVDFANPQVDSKTGTFTLRAEIPNPNRELLPGQFTRVKVLLNVIENAVLIPKKSIIIEKGGEFVFVMRSDSIVEKRFIQTGDELKSSVVVNRGLLSWEKVVTEGLQKLQHGIKIIPTTPTDSIWINKPKLED
ncbi:efflux RND transporter periplasmic adaptor subunit [Carboxylicivirga linearis]|uniref:Efflux RND transporter periplasmic adaptor subunit n=1 Tax=Carboxylicivirga linearis TaxID=1628157 RepID=A0ABS5JXU0_9BACT|nr:efflux RND transporter periplasmic adaptor subunit [Carboxylicivirga linearis]MBS2099696.1 efflux RND transporter periplasmic adaptor subunit [Carboxylicivirga linearis]